MSDRAVASTVCAFMRWSREVCAWRERKMRVYATRERERDSRADLYTIDALNDLVECRAWKMLCLDALGPVDQILSANREAS
ncbi:hypothetical protein Tco_0098672 [Tanacetum coccineum]